VKRVGMVAHAGRPPAVAVAHDLVRWLKGEQVGTRCLVGEPVGAEEETPEASFAAGLDLVVSVGGDGTFLRAARLAAQGGCPIVGVKVGRMGFLTEVEPEEATEVLQGVLDGTARIEERMAVVTEVEGVSWPEPEWALNEIMVEKSARHRIVRLAVEFDEEYVTTFSADGVLVATPTGSTAYSFAARGPIVTPTFACLVVTPVAAYTVFDRSFVLGPGQRVTFEVVGDEAALISADGRESVEVPVGSRINIRAADRPALLVRRDGPPGFFGLVREKFHLPGGEG